MDAPRNILIALVTGLDMVPIGFLRRAAVPADTSKKKESIDFIYQPRIASESVKERAVPVGKHQYGANRHRRVTPMAAAPIFPRLVPLPQIGPRLDISWHEQITTFLTLR